MFKINQLIFSPTYHIDGIPARGGSLCLVRAQEGSRITGHCAILLLQIIQYIFGLMVRWYLDCVHPAEIS